MSGGNRGRGRGEFIRQLLEATNTTSATTASSSTEEKSTKVSGDSGVGVSHLRTFSPPPGASFENESLISESSTSTTKAEISVTAPTRTLLQGRGRAQLFETFRTFHPADRTAFRTCAEIAAITADDSSSSTSRPSEVEVKSSVGTEVKSMRGLGRGRIIEMLLSKPETTSVASSQLVAELSKDIGKLNVKSEEESPTEPEPEIVVQRGTKGQTTAAVSNYILLKSDPGKGVYEYEVCFEPNMDNRNVRMGMLNEHRDKFGGTKTFDGVTLYLPIRLPDKVTRYTSINRMEGTQVVEIQLIYKRQKSLRDCMHLYNVLFDRIMKTLKYVRHARKQYDPTAPIVVPQHRLEIWPGYVTAVDEYDGGVMLCCDVAHRILCQTTVLDALRDAHHGSEKQGDFQVNAKKALIGAVVLTRYNNKTYRVDDIKFDLNPMSTFKAGDREMTFFDYYKTQYNITIRDVKQPMLVSIQSRRVSGRETAEELVFCLVPEICYVTGLRDEQRADFHLMRDIATFTRVTPNQRIASLKKFYRNVNNNKEAREILDSWGLSMGSEPERLMGRQLEQEMVSFRHKQFPVGVNADFGKYATNNELIKTIDLNNWVLIHCERDSRAANNFMDCVQKNAAPMGIAASKPKIVSLSNDRTETYVNALRQVITPTTQIIVTICPTARDDRYSAIKKICCAEIPVPSQVINARTLLNESKNRSIVQKILLQMNCKLGGTLWSIKIPFQNVMICGIDTYHEANNRKQSVSAFVASLDASYTRWYSKPGIQEKNEEIVNGLVTALKLSLLAYEEYNRRLPEKIIIFRDGVGDGQLKLCTEYELPQLQQGCRLHRSGYDPLFTFVVVQKRINTRLFADIGGKEVANPNPGFVLDHTITRKNLYDFFLVSQSVRQGTVTPTHYIVVYDSAKFAPDILQRLSYKLCFMYYNWPGTVRVPACCQYAHKLAYLVGNSIKRPTSEKLASKLFYL